jgi:hypothetical protein
MDYYISKDTLGGLEKIVYDINIKLLKEVHKKFLKDLDFEELQNILDGLTKKTFSIEVNDSDSD